MINSSGVVDVKSAQAAMKNELMIALTTVTLRKPKARMICAASVFMPSAPNADANVYKSRFKRRKAKPNLHEERQQERQRPYTEPVQEAAR